MLKKLIRQMRRRSAYNHSVNMLSSMTDKQLRDIGICRGDIRDISWQHAMRKDQ